MADLIRTRLCRMVPWVALSIMPILILVTGYDSRNGFLRLIYFGQNFQDNRIQEIREIDPPNLSPSGYDGQFYAQIAVDPSLRHEGLKNATYGELAYRARRIGLPFLAFCLGMGQPFPILQAYALLNFLFWILLLITLDRYQKLNTSRGILLAISIMWSTGTLTSLARSVPDLPAVAFSTWALVLQSHPAANLFIGIAALFKETAILSFPRVAWPEGKDPNHAIRKYLVSALIVFGPIMAWSIYIYFHLPTETMAGTGNFSFPFFGLFNKMQGSVKQLLDGFSHREWLYLPYFLFELVCPLSLLIQSVYMIIHYNTFSNAWKTGIGFVVLFCFLGSGVWGDQYAYSRVLLPLTVSFNFLIHEQEAKSSFRIWYLLGNSGMSWMCIETVSRSFFTL
jgi:hypothetical protein